MEHLIHKIKDFIQNESKTLTIKRRKMLLSNSLQKIITISITIFLLNLNLVAQTGFFTSADSLNESRQNTAMTMLNDGRLLIVGGVPGTGNVGAGPARLTAETYDLLTDTWELTGSMSIERQYPQATLLNDGNVLVTGGGSGSVSPSSFTNLAEIFDVSVDTFYSLSDSMVDERAGHAAVLLKDSTVLIAGGFNSSGTLSSAEIYDPNDSTFTSVGSMNTPRQWGSSGPAVVLLGTGKVLIVGGNSTVAEAELYDPISGTFSLTGALNINRGSTKLSLLEDGKVLIVGGRSSSGVENTAEIYDPVTGTFTLISATMTTPRERFTVNLLDNGEVLIVGGLTGVPDENLASAEIFNPATESFYPAGSMSQARFDHVSGSLTGSRVLITGGGFDPPTGSGSIGLSITEIFHLPVMFAEVGAGAGVDDNTGGFGVAWGDYDNDGDLDLYLVNGTFPSSQPNRLYRNNGNGSFTEVGASAGVDHTGDGHGASWGDYDNDGDLDLYVANASGQTDRLYRNNGNGIFTEVGGTAGITAGGTGRSVAWADYDKDGYLDLYLANHGTNRLYRNNGNGTFTDVGSTAGVNDTGNGRGVAWGDYDNDGDLDLYLANEATNRLYRNNGDGTFTEVGSTAGVAHAGDGVGATWGDYDNDGNLDLYLTNQYGPNSLYRNNANGTFSEVATSAGVDDSHDGQSAAWGDFDNDGDLDLYVTNADTSNLLYQNNGNGTFSDVGAIAGVNDGGIGQGVTWGDYDKDGDLDIYVANRVGTPNRLYQNQGTNNNWLSIKLIGTTSNLDGIGARVITQAGNLRQIREVDGGSGYLSQPSLPLEFGLGDASVVDSLIIEWPSGIIEQFTNVNVNQFITVVEDEGIKGLAVKFEDDVIYGATGDTISIAIVIDDSSIVAIYSSEFDLSYDSTVVTILGVDVEGTLAGDAGWSIADTVKAGHLKVAMAGATPLSSGDTLINIVLYVNDSTVIGESSPLQFVSFLFNEGSPSSNTVDGTITVRSIYGDVSESGEVHAFDATLVLAYLANDTATLLDTIGDTTLSETRKVVAEVSGDSNITEHDASLILQYVAGVIPSFTVEGGPAAPLAEGVLAMQDTVVFPRGAENVTIYINLVNGAKVYSGRFLVKYNAESLEFVEFNTTEATMRFTTATKLIEGEIEIFIAGNTEVTGSEPIVEVIFKRADGGSYSEVILVSAGLNENLYWSGVDTTVVDFLTDVSNESEVPRRYALSQNYPNPFNPLTTIRYTLPKQSDVSLVIYNILGEEVKRFAEFGKEAGYHEFVWDASGAASGVYLYRLRAGDFLQTKKMLLLK